MLDVIVQSDQMSPQPPSGLPELGQLLLQLTLSLLPGQDGGTTDQQAGERPHSLVTGRWWRCVTWADSVGGQARMMPWVSGRRS